MRLSYFQAEDPFAAASARSEQAFSAACLPPAVLCDTDDDDALSCTAAGAPLMPKRAKVAVYAASRMMQPEDARRLASVAPPRPSSTPR